MLSRDQAKQYYERHAAKQDRQGFYEDPPLTRLIAHLPLADLHEVFEFGCGTGRLAEHLLARHLSETTRFLSVDLSEAMVRRARARLVSFGNRARVDLTDGSLPLPANTARVDCVLSSYVLDLLPDAEIEAVLAEAARVLVPGGYLGLVNLTHGTTPLSRLNMWRWQLLYRLNPTWVGGCRSLEMKSRLDSPTWNLLHHSVVVASWIPSEVLVAQKV